MSGVGLGAAEILARSMYAELDEHGYEDDDEKRGQVAHHFAAHQLDALKAAGYEVVEHARLTSMIKACNENADDAARDESAHCEEMFYRGQAVAYSVVLDGTLTTYQQVISGTAADAAEAGR